MLQVSALQRTGGSSLCLSIAYTYDFFWTQSMAEPATNIVNKYEKGLLDPDVIYNMSKKLEVKPILLCHKIQDLVRKYRMAPDSKIDTDSQIIIDYLKEIYKKIKIQKVLGLVTLTDSFLKNDIQPIFCSRYLDQYLLSHMNLGLNPVNILNTYQGILDNNHNYILQNILNKMREAPIFSYCMGNVDQYPACARWVIHSFHCINYSYQYNIPIVWTGDNSTKGSETCNYIRSILGKENGEKGSLEENLLKKHLT